VINWERFVWSQGDVLALPPWALCEAALFSIRDRPAMEALGFYREEALVENGGHQEVMGVFSPE
jgi:gentisate 1,2-dioxygenase